MIQDFVALLETALELDKEAVQNLIESRVRCNDKIVAHKDIVCYSERDVDYSSPYMTVDSDEIGGKVFFRHYLGILGILNGVFSQKGELICAVYDENKKLTGFEIRKKETFNGY